MKWTVVGKISGAHGLKGDLLVYIFSGEFDWLSKAKEIQLTLPGENNVPKLYKVERISPYQKGLRVKLAGVEDRTQAEQLKTFQFLIPAELLVSKKGETIFLKEIIGFKVLSSEGEIGQIIAISSNGIQDLLVVNYRGAEVEIPFVEQFLERIVHEEKIIQMQLPEGLLEINQVASLQKVKS